MATVMVPRTVCDRCGKPDETVDKRRLVLPNASKAGRSVSFDACQWCRDNVPLSEWEKLIPKKPRATKANLVVSEEEVLAAAKREGRRRTVKKAARR